MISHSITPFVKALPSRQEWQQTRGWLDKQAYAKMLNELPFKKGHILVNKHLDMERVTQSAFFVVMDIQEIHHLCDYDNSQGTPAARCLLLKSVISPTAALGAWYASASVWQLATDEQIAKFGLNNVATFNNQTQ